MSRPLKWDTTVQQAIAQADRMEVPPRAILEGLRSGTLPGLTRSYAMPERTFYDYLARVRVERGQRPVRGASESVLLARLSRTDDAAETTEPAAKM